VLGVWGLSTPTQGRLALIGTSILVAAAGWFLYVQVIFERQFCPYCMVMHLCGLAAFVGVLAHVWSRDLSERAASLFLAGGVASLAMTALVAGQFFGPQPATHEITLEDQLAEMAAQTVARHDVTPDGPVDDADEGEGADQSTARGQDAANEPLVSTADEPESNRDVGDAPPTDDPPVTAAHQESKPESGQPIADRGREVSYFDGAIKFSLNDVPLIGRPDARHILLKYFDYTCPSCRRMHLDLAAAVKAYPDDLAVIVIPCPLNVKCNPYADEEASRARGPGSHEFACELARLALAMWRLAPEEFERFHNELFARQDRMTPSAAILVGNSMLDQPRLEEAVHDPWIDALLEHSIGIYGRMKKSNPRMPKVLLGDRKVLHGVVVNTDGLIDLLRQQFQLGEPQ
jgi:hypothetical protein